MSSRERTGTRSLSCPQLLIRTTPRCDQSVGAKPFSDRPSSSMRSTICSRIRPSHRAGRPLPAVRSRVCHLRPSVSQGAFTSPSTRRRRDLRLPAARSIESTARLPCYRAVDSGLFAEPNSARSTSVSGLFLLPRAFSGSRPRPGRQPAFLAGWLRAPARGTFPYGCAGSLTISSGVPSATRSPPADSGLRAKVDHPVGRLDDFQVVLDHNDGVAQIGQAVDHVQKLAHVVEVQAGGGLVEDVERLPGIRPRQLGGQLDALSFAAGERGRRLAERDVTQPHVVERLENSPDPAARSQKARAQPKPKD